MGSLSNLYISQSYQSLIHLATNNTASAALIGLEDGLGNPIGVSVNTAGNLYLSGTFSASLQEGYIYVGNSSGRTIAFPTSSFITELETGSLLTTASFNAYTASTNIRLSNIEIATASILVSIAALNSATSSYITETESGSFLITASFDNGTRNLTFTKGNNTTFAVNIPDVSGSTIDTGSFATTGSNIFTGVNQFQSGAIVNNSLNVSLTAGRSLTVNSDGLEWDGTLDNKPATFKSYVNITKDLNVTGSLTASLQAGYVWVGNASGKTTTIPTSSFVNVNQTGSFVTTSSFNAYTQSANIRLNNLETTSASVNTSITNINQYTQSNNLKWQDLGSKSGSWITESETGSFARYDVSNPWSADQTFTNISAVSASFTYVQTVFETASVIYSSGSNQFGDELTDVQTLSGSVLIRGGLVVNGLDVTQSISSINSFTASANSRLNNLEAATASYITETETGSFIITSSFSGDTLNFTKGNGSTYPIQGIVNTGSSTITGTMTFSADSNAQARWNLSGSDWVGIQKQVGLNRLIWVDNNNEKLLSLDLDTDQFSVSGGFDAKLQQGYVWVGDSTNRTLAIPTSSLVVNIDTGSLVTTSSFNAYTQSNDQRVTSLESNSASVNTSITNINLFTQSADIRLDNLESTSASVNVSITNLNSFTQSADIRLDNLEAATGSYITESESGSFLITGSVAGNVLTFTKGDNTTFNLTVATGSGGGGSTDTGSLLVTASFNNSTRNITFTKGDASQFNLGGFATTGSNTFTDSQAIFANNAITISGSNGFGYGITLQGAQGIKLEGSGGPRIQFPNSTWFNGNENEDLIFTADTDNPLTRGLDFFLYGSGSQRIRFRNNSGPGATIVFTNQSGSISFTAGSSISMTGSSLQLQGLTYPNVDGTNGQVLTTNGAGTLSFTTVSGSSVNTGSLLVTASVNLNTITFTKGDNTTFALTVDTGSGGGGGVSFSNPNLNTHSSSLFLIANTFNSGAANFAHISSSAQNQANLIFKNNNNTGTTQVSGSNNIFTNPGTPAAGRVNYIGGVSNLFLNGQSQQLPTITGSAASVSGNRPTMNANYIAGTHTWTINQAPNPGAHTYNNNLTLGTGAWAWNMVGNTGTVVISNNLGANSTMTLNSPSRSFAQINAGESGSNALTMLNNISLGAAFNYNGPVSSSTHTISSNVLAGATYTLNAQSSSRALTSNNNIVVGTVTFNDNTQFSPTLGSINAISNNSIVGTLNITNRASSSISVTQNNINTTFIDNQLDASVSNPVAQRLASVGNNLTVGSLHSIFFSGSLGTTSGSRQLNASIIAGLNISASMVGDGSGSNIFATSILGRGLNVIGTNELKVVGQPPETAGSLFTGRWNAEDGNRARTAQTIFAVGTGTSGSAGIVRKTGLLIDSGSNTFIEGTLNVSGSSTLSGSLYIQSGSTLPVSTGSAILTWNAATGQVNQASFSTIVSASVSSAEFWSTTTQSGSAGVSGSIQFNNSGSFYNVSLVNGTQLTVVNAGVYNIQFSAQVETSAGADTVYIWFKKNGTNIGDSASKAVLANNTAQVITVNILDQAAANDYYEIAYQNINGHATVLAEVASGNIPAIPSVIATIIQVR